MDIVEYNKELEMMKENFKVCKENEKVLKHEAALIDELLKMEPQNGELLRLKVKANQRYFTNDDMIRALHGALNLLKEDKEISGTYECYVALYANLVKTYVAISESEEFLYLANKYIPNTVVENNV